MGKTIYTERDVELLAARGVTDIPVNDDVIVTAVAREKMEKLGMKYDVVAPGETRTSGSVSSATVSARPVGSPARSDAEREALVEQAKAAVIARLGPAVDTEIVEKAVRAAVNRLRP